MVTRELNGGIRGLNICRFHGSIRIQFNLGRGWVYLNLELKISSVLCFAVVSYRTGGRPLTSGNFANNVVAPRLLDAPVERTGLNGDSGLLTSVLLGNSGYRVQGGGVYC